MLFPLLLIVFGITNFGLAYFQKIQLSGAAREGARTMAVKNDAGLAEAAARSAAPALKQELMTVSVGTCVPGEPVTVELTYKFSYIFIDAFIDAPDTELRGVGVMRCNG